MKKSILVLILLTVFFCLEGKAEVPSDEYYPNGELKVQWGHNAENDMLLRKEYYLNGIVKSEGIYKNEKLEGPYKEYYENNQLFREVDFHQGKQEGIYREYLFTGEKKVEATYSDGKLNGVYQEYFEDGTLYTKINYKNDVRNGMVEIFYPSGVRQVQMFFKDDRPSGTYQEYDEEGHLKVNDVIQEEPQNKRQFQEAPIDSLQKTQGAKAAPPTQVLPPTVAGASSNSQEKVPFLSSRGKFFTQTIYLYLFLLACFLTWKFLSYIHKTPQPLQKSFNVAWSSVKRVTTDKLFSSSPAGVRKASVSSVTDFKPAVSPKINNEAKFFKDESSVSYRRLVDTLKGGVFIADLTGKLIYANHTLSTLLGYSTKTDIVGLNINHEFIDSDTKQNTLLEVMKNKGELNNFIFTYKGKRTAPIALCASGAYIYDAHGDVVGIEGIVQDVTGIVEK